MIFITIILLSFALAMDAFAVCISYGICNRNSKFRDAFRLAFHTALFQVLMPLLGYICGNLLGKFVSKYSPFIAFATLLIIGIKMIIESFNQKEECERVDFSRGKALIFICIATSIDAFAAGISLALLGLPMYISLIFIGTITFVISFSGVYLGKFVGHFIEKWAEIFGGVILIIIGVKILIEKLFF